MSRRNLLSITVGLTLSLLLLSPVSWAQQAKFQSPEDYLGHRVGADKKLVKWDKIQAYFRQAGERTERVRIQDVGLSTEGRKMILAVIAAPQTLKDLDKHKAAQRKLADPRLIKDDVEKKQLAETSKIIIYINCGIHSSETASALMSMELMHYLATSNLPEVREVLDRAIVLLMPSSNPDGTDIVAEWYESSLGKAWEGGGLPRLYHKYAGHDDNRDWFMLNLVETRNITKFLYKEWFPTIVLDVHQMGSGGARQFVPPYKAPVNPNVHPVIHQSTDLIGAHMALELARHNKKGVVHSALFDLWWSGSTLSEPRNHNMIAILSETASCKLATPITVDLKKLKGGTAGGPQPVTPNTLDPWPGGIWRLRDAVDYQLIVCKSLLTTSARFHDMFQANYVKLGEEAIQRGKEDAPFAWLIPLDGFEWIPVNQQDMGATLHLLRLLDAMGVEIHSADEAFVLEGAKYREGTPIIYAAQPYRAAVKNLMEPQKYPRRLTAKGEIERPYDVTGWTLPLQMGVKSVTVAKPLKVKASKLTSIPRPRTMTVGKPNPVAQLLAAASNDDYRLINRLHKRGVKFSVLVKECADPRAPAGSLVIHGKNPLDDVFNAENELSLSFRGLSEEELKQLSPNLRPVPAPRVALHQPWAPSMDEGWTRLVLEQFEFPYTTLHNPDVLKGELRERFDCIILPSVAVKTLLAGQSAKATDPKYAGGLGAKGVANLKEFVKAGGTLVCIDASCDLPIRMFGIPVRNVVTNDDGLALESNTFFCPGSILAATCDPSHPVAYGRPSQLSVYFARSQAFEIVKDKKEDKKKENEEKERVLVDPSAIQVVARYAEKDVLQSGFLQGEQVIAGKAAILDVPYGKGRVILFGCRVQNRAQPHGTFRLLFNAIQGSTVGR